MLMVIRLFYCLFVFFFISQLKASLPESEAKKVLEVYEKVNSAGFLGISFPKLVEQLPDLTKERVLEMLQTLQDASLVRNRNV